MSAVVVFEIVFEFLTKGVSLLGDAMLSAVVKVKKNLADLYDLVLTKSVILVIWSHFKVGVDQVYKALRVGRIEGKAPRTSTAVDCA